jgi:eukaryotic-like serine/threonine-protein kinase
VTTPSKRRDKSKDLALVGTTIAGKYRVIQLLGQGGFGSVFLVEIIAGMVGEKLALKLIPTEFCGDEKVKGQFLNEVRVAMRMVNKYIVQIRDVGETESGQLYYTMDYCPGTNLGELLKRDGKTTPPRAVSFGLRILDALKTAHAAGVIHRDLKPANVMVFSQDSHETIRVLDFGIATAIQAKSSGENFVGSPHYMPPEQFLNEELGFYTDTYSVGVILYECVTGQRPYRGRTAQEVYNDLKKRPATPPEEVNPALADYPELCRVISRSLERNPDLRYPTAKEMFAELKTSLDPKPEPAPAAAAAPAPVGRRRRGAVSTARGGASKAPGAAIGIGAGLALLAVVLFFLLRGSPPGHPGGSSSAADAPPTVAAGPPSPAAKADPSSGETDQDSEPPSLTPEEEAKKKRMETHLPSAVKVAPAAVDPEIKKREDAKRSRELVTQALDLSKTGNAWEKVRDLARDAIELNETEAEAYRLKGQAELELHQFEDAQRSLEGARSRLPAEKVDAALLLALLDAQAGLPSPSPPAMAQIEDEALEALKKEPKCCEGAVKLLGYMDKDGRDREVVALLRQIEPQGCTDPTIGTLREEYLVKRPRELEKKAREILKDARVAYDGDDFALAARKAEEGFKLRALPEIGLLLAESYQELHKPKEMLMTLGEVARAVGEDAEGLIRVGILYGRAHIDDFEATPAKKDSMDKALMNINAAVEVLNKEPKNKFPSLLCAARTYRARCYAYQGSLAKLDDEIKNAGSIDINMVYYQAESFYILAERVSEPDRSEAYRKVIRRLPLYLEGKETSKDPRGPFLAGRALLKLGQKPENFNKAINYFVSAERLGMKGRPELYNSIAECYLGLGEIIKAAQKYRDSFNAQPTEDACLKSATYFIQVNNRRSAEEILTEGLKAFPPSKPLKQLLDSIRR